MRPRHAAAVLTLAAAASALVVPGPGSPAAAAPAASAVAAPAAAVAERSRHVPYTDASGTTSTYHLDVPAGGAAGLLVYLDGDGMFAVDHPDGDLLGRRSGLAATAAARGLAVLTPRTPDASTNTWWRAADRNSAWVRELTRAVDGRLHLGGRRVYFAGYSGGAQLLTKSLLPADPDLCTGGAVITGGGGAPSRRLGRVPGCPLTWITGTADVVGYNALADARRGADAYARAGARTTISTPDGLDHAALRVRLRQLIPGTIDGFGTP